MTVATASSEPTKPPDQARPAVADRIVTAPVMMKNFSTRRHFGVFSSNWPNRMLPTANRLAIAETSIHKFMTSFLGHDSLPQEITVQDRNQDPDPPGQRLHPPRADERSHLVAVAREHHPREDPETEPHAPDPPT